MLKKNNLFTGAALGAVAPVMAYWLTEHTSLGTRFVDKPLLLYVIAATLNLLLARYFYRRQAAKTGGSLIGITFVGLLLLLVFKEGFTI
ncbi:hypothetical protein GCM10023231_26880 [Olivibacter ginsenosidimutans]|uniref:Stationary phase survival protein SurE n=1 Tax=Olivibacter ginsenosidimutans TaxID=1176537 RepID=A0ABP9BNF6_9SPHI